MDSKVFRKQLGEVIRRLREADGLSQEALAERAQIDRTYVSIVERGLKSPTIDTFVRICAALNTPPDGVLSSALRRARRKN